MSISTIKAQVKILLDELVTDEVLGAAKVTDIRKDPLSADHPAFPIAYLMPPSVESMGLDNRTNTRAYTFDIMVLFNAENITGTDDVEVATEAIFNKFDNAPTLGGSALGGMSPLTQAPVPFQHAGTGKDLIMVVVQVTAQDHVALTF